MPATSAAPASPNQSVTASAPSPNRPRLTAVTHDTVSETTAGGYALSRQLDDTGLPNPDALLRNLARSVVEIIAGVREVEQVARWVSPDVFSKVLQRAQHAKRSRALRGLAVRRPTVRARACLWQSPRPGVVEGTVVVDIGARARAVAIRLESWRGRWRAERIHVL